MTLAVMVAYAAPGVAEVVRVTVPEGAKVADAVAASGLVARLQLVEGGLVYAIYGQRADRDTPLMPGDRVELTRPLIVDPKVARRARAARTRAAKAGSRK